MHFKKIECQKVSTISVCLEKLHWRQSSLPKNCTGYFKSGNHVFVIPTFFHTCGEPLVEKLRKINRPELQFREYIIRKIANVVVVNMSEILVDGQLKPVIGNSSVRLAN